MTQYQGVLHTAASLDVAASLLGDRGLARSTTTDDACLGAGRLDAWAWTGWERTGSRDMYSTHASFMQYRMPCPRGCTWLGVCAEGGSCLRRGSPTTTLQQPGPGEERAKARSPWVASCVMWYVRSIVSSMSTVAVWCRVRPPGHVSDHSKPQLRSLALYPL